MKTEIVRDEDDNCKYVMPHNIITTALILRKKVRITEVFFIF